MNNKKVILEFVTKNQKSKEKAERIATLLTKTLEIESSVIVTKYDKFENAFKITYEFYIENKINFTHTMIELTNRICSPWLVYFHRDLDEIELIFNQTDFSRIGNKEFHVINWARLYIE